MSKIFIEEFTLDLKRTLEQIRFVAEEREDGREDYDNGVLIGIQLCIKELEKRLEEI